MSAEQRDQFNQIHQACIQAHPKLAETPESSIAGSFSPDVEEDANIYFQKIYTNQLTIEQIVNLLQQFKNSTNQKSSLTLSPSLYFSPVFQIL